MSLYLCELHGSTVPGSLDNVYVRLLDGPDRYRRKIRLCRDHTQDFLAVHKTDWQYVHPIYGADLHEACSKCGVVLDAGVACDRLFVDVYAKGQERATWAALYCLPCAVAIRTSLELSLEERPRSFAAGTGSLSRSEGPAGEHRGNQGEARGVVHRLVLGEDHPETADDDDQTQHGADD
jgi:hypothetical protein